MRRLAPRAGLTCGALLVCLALRAVYATPHIPAGDAEVLAELPPGTQHTSAGARELARNRLDVALPLARFYIARARASGDLRYLGYAQAALDPWLARTVSPNAAVLVLAATIQQSRHDFGAALATLAEALRLEPNDVQAWLTRATVLRVLGRYSEAASSCAHLASRADPALEMLCAQTLRALTGHLAAAYATLRDLPPQSLPSAARAWRDSELGEMAVRLGDEAAAEHWFRDGLALSPDDLYLRTAWADLLLRQGRTTQVLQLLAGYESIEPALLRIVIAQSRRADPRAARSRTLLADAFAIEQQRGDGVHRREQARFLLDVEQRPDAALVAAQENWRVQREPDDALILLRCARAAQQPAAAAPVRQFLQQQGLQDVRLEQ